MSNGGVIWTDNHYWMTDERAAGVHLFERAGMGKAPFRVISYGKTQGTCCNYCGTPCIYVAVIRSSDGVDHRVGLDCVMKVGDAGLATNIKRSAEYRKIQRDRRHALDQKKSTEIDQLLAKLDADGFGPSADQFRYRLGWCGAAGRARILKELREFKHER